MRLLLLCACLLALVGIAGCASINTVAAGSPAKVAPPAVARAGTILSMRQVTREKVPPQWGAVLLADASASNIANDSSKTQAKQLPLEEFIVRTDDGAILSVVQTNEAGFHVGDRVIILRGEQARLARPG